LKPWIEGYMPVAAGGGKAGDALLMRVQSLGGASDFVVLETMLTIP
jgi:hypothetical protein